jgi:hypothetical protein
MTASTISDRGSPVTTTTVRVRRRLVDATYVETSIPSTLPPPFAVDQDAVVVAPNDLVSLPGQASFTDVGAGKSAMDTCCWLVDNGVDAGRIRWIRPRDAWTNDRASIQPLRLVAGFTEWVAAVTEASAAATDLRDLCLRMEDAGALVRLDPDVEPTFWAGRHPQRDRAGDVGQHRADRADGSPRHVGATRIELEQDSIATRAGQVHVDCTAAGLGCAPNSPVFERDRITVQYIQHGLARFNGRPHRLGRG